MTVTTWFWLTPRDSVTLYCLCPLTIVFFSYYRYLHSNSTLDFMTVTTWFWLTPRDSVTLYSQCSMTIMFFAGFLHHFLRYQLQAIFRLLSLKGLYNDFEVCLIVFSSLLKAMPDFCSAKYQQTFVKIQLEPTSVRFPAY